MSFIDDLNAFAAAATRFAAAMEAMEGAKLRAMAAEMDSASAAIEKALGLDSDPIVAPATRRSDTLDADGSVTAVMESARWTDRTETLVPTPPDYPQQVDAAVKAIATAAATPPMVVPAPEAGPTTTADDTPPWETGAAPEAEPAKEGGRRTNEQIAADYGVSLADVKAWKAANSIGTNRVKAEEIKAYSIAVRQGAVPGQGPAAMAALQQGTIDDFLAPRPGDPFAATGPDPWADAVQVPTSSDEFFDAAPAAPTLPF